MRVSKFKIFGRETTHSKTRRGVAAWSKIRNEQGEVVGELDDQAEAIVAHVTFKSPEIRKEFLEEAKMALKDVVSPTHGEEYFISEYARTMSMDADLDYVEELKKRK